jgi:seryl-tRNA synthetase
MIDIKFLRENPDVIRESQKGRGEDPKLVDRVLKADENRREAIVKFEALRAEQNIFSKSVGSAKGEEKTALLEEGKKLSLTVKQAEQSKTQADAEANLTKSIKAGGSGKWGPIPMPPQAQLSDADAKTLAAWVLSGAK